MIYTDGIHVVADTLPELHTFAKLIGLKYYHGFRKGHPHYDIIGDGMLEKVLQSGVEFRSDRELLKIAKKTKP